MRVMKFGGKSLASLEKMQNVCRFIKKAYQNDKKIIVIVSAMGILLTNSQGLQKNLVAKTLLLENLQFCFLLAKQRQVA